MSVPAIAERPIMMDGRARSAALMRALGAQANAVWSALSSKEAAALTAAMDALPEDTAFEDQAVRAFVRDMETVVSPQPSGKASIWSRVSALDGAKLASLVSKENPQIIAVILSQLSAQSAAATVRALPKALATEALKRLLNLGEVHPAAMTVIERNLELSTAQAPEAGLDAGHERVARIFDNLSDQIEDNLLNDLDRAEPGAGERIRALMFTFDDLATLGPASLQTLLSHTERAALTLALKGAKPDTANAFFANMTARARELLISEIEASGPLRRSDIQQARQDITAMARTLVNRGDIISGGETKDDELIE